MVAKEGDPLLLGQFYALSGKVINDRFKYTKRRFSQLEPEGKWWFGSIKNWMGPYQRTPKEVARAMRYSGLGVLSVGPVGDFLDWKMFFLWVKKTNLSPWIRGNFHRFSVVFFLSESRRLFPKILPNGSSKTPSMMWSGNNLKAGRGRAVFGLVGYFSIHEVALHILVEIHIHIYI